MKKFWFAQIKKDFLWSYSYKLSFFGQFFALFITIVPIYFLGKTFMNSTSTHLEEYGQNYFLFAILGVNFAAFIIGCMGSASKAIRSAQVHGYIDNLLNCKISMSYIIFCSMLYPFIIGLTKVFITVLIAYVIDDFNLSISSILGIVFVCFLTFISFVGFGLFSASFVLIFKQGDPVNFFLIMIITIFSGTIYPVSVLPPLFQELAALTPFTVGLDVLRKIVIFDDLYSISVESIFSLLTFALGTTLVGLCVLSISLKRVKILGTSGLY